MTRENVAVKQSVAIKSLKDNYLKIWLRDGSYVAPAWEAWN